MTTTSAATAPDVQTVLVGLPRALHVDAALRGLPVEPFMGDVLSNVLGWVKVRNRATGEVHNLPPVYVLTPIIPFN